MHLTLWPLLCVCRVSEFVLDEACQVFGGRAISRTGMGQVSSSSSSSSITSYKREGIRPMKSPQRGTEGRGKRGGGGGGALIPQPMVPLFLIPPPPPPGPPCSPSAFPGSDVTPKIVERYMRGTKFGAILGGSEEIMADLGMRQAMKNFPLHARL